MSSLFISCWCSVAQWCLTLCDPMDCSTPGFPVFHHLSEFAQTHVQWVGNAIQPYCPLSSLLKEYSGLISFRIDWFDLLEVQGTLKVFSNITVQKQQFFGTQSSLWSNAHIHTWLQENLIFDQMDLCWQSNVSAP